MINYSLEYDLKKDNLIVTVSNCQDLPKGLDSLDPYVVVSMMSEKDEAAGKTRGTKPKTSKTVRNSGNPVFNFSCVFPVKKKSELKEKIVVFEVFDWDYGIKHDMVARKVVHLRRLGEGLDEILGRTADFSKALRRGLPRDERGPGDICLSLYYAAKNMSLTVSIIECKGVFVAKGRSEEPDLETLPNTFVRLSLRHPQLKREQVKRSKQVSGTRNPYFNQQFVFEVGARDMLETCILRITLVHKTETLRLKRPVGSLELHAGADPDSLPLLHWRELLQTPNRAVARWHNLITPEAEERNRKIREKEEKRRLQELQEEAEAAAETAAPSGNR
ncbi:hypothetical protein BOX15_Mlig021003g3 [Macrostomum lignano]|uniref:C2 domain-containing protein n=1 Tax=Macrostomum lignano TaxID=282301 RepID=A0A267DDW3_9PLAT|nr:hypothetical protein BOX15_Mlig021003g3 [Macrostomum lignano]